MRGLKLVVLSVALGLGCGAAATELWPSASQRGAGEPLYFALEVTQNGQVVARPQLVGVSGKDVRLLLHHRDGSPRMALLLHPSLAAPYDGNHYGVEVQLELPGEGLQRSLELQHGEVIHTAMSNNVEVSLMMMRVRSPEFEAFIREAPVTVHEAPPEASDE